MADVSATNDIVTAEQAAWVLNCQPHDVPVLVAVRLLRPLGNSPPNRVKFQGDQLAPVADGFWGTTGTEGHFKIGDLRFQNLRGIRTCLADWVIPIGGWNGGNRLGTAVFRTEFRQDEQDGQDAEGTGG